MKKISTKLTVQINQYIIFQIINYTIIITFLKWQIIMDRMIPISILSILVEICSKKEESKSIHDLQKKTTTININPNNIKNHNESNNDPISYNSCNKEIAFFKSQEKKLKSKNYKD